DSSMTLRPVVFASGAPTGTSTWTVTLKDGVNTPASRSFTVTYAPPTTALNFSGLSPNSFTTTTVPYTAATTASGSNFNNVNEVDFSCSGSTSGSTTWLKNDSNWPYTTLFRSDSSMTLRPVVFASGAPTGTSTW